MKLKLTLLTLLLAFLTFASSAQQSKVIERSAKSLPNWLSTNPKGFLVVEVEAPNMSAAKDKAIEELSTRIVMSVAANVTHSSFAEGKTENNDGRITDKESFGFNTKIAAANIPFIKGISLSEAKDTYWEKCKEKKTDRIFYRYAILYPFPDSQLTQMRKEFEEMDSEKTNKLKSLKENIDKVNSSLQIEQAIADLNELKEYFFDDVRRTEAESVQKNYKHLYKGLTLKADKPKGGKVKVTLQLNGNLFEVTGVPTLKSNCATKLQASPLPNGCGFEITYDDIDCLSDEENWIEINLRMRDTRVVQKIFI